MVLNTLLHMQKLFKILFIKFKSCLLAIIFFCTPLRFSFMLLAQTFATPLRPLQRLFSVAEEALGSAKAPANNIKEKRNGVQKKIRLVCTLADRLSKLADYVSWCKG